MNMSLFDTLRQLLEHKDFFDWEKSEYITRRNKPDKISIIDKLILNVSLANLPPIFRLLAHIGHLLIPAKTKDAFEKAGIKGIIYGSQDNLDARNR